MKVKVHGRVQPVRHGGVNQSFYPSQLTSPFLSSILGPEKRNADVYRTMAISSELVNKFLCGFNASLIVLGESGSGKSHTLGLERHTVEDGIILSVFSDVFGTMRDKTVRFDISMTELYSETFRDLLRFEEGRTNADVVDVDVDVARGPHLRNLARCSVESRDQCRELLLEGLERRRNEEREFGSVKHFTTLILTLHMSQLDVSSTFSIFCLAGAERLVASSEVLRLKEGPHLSKSILKFERLVTDLSESMSTSPRQVVRYEDSKLTHLLVDVLGGNSVTHVLCTFKPESNTVADTVMCIAKELAQIDNFPIENTEDAKKLLALYRAAIQYYKTEHAGRDAGHLPVDDRQDTQRPVDSGHLAAKDHALQLERDIVKLRERNMRLEVTVGKLKQQCDEATQQKTKVSSELVASEEEKLKLAQTLIDMQLDKNQLEKEAIEKQHQLETEILQLKDETEVLCEDVKKASRAAEDAQMKCKEIEVDHQELRDEHVALNANFVSVREKLQDEQRKNEELGMEVINLVNVKAVLMQQSDQYKSETDKLKAQQNSLTSQALTSEHHGKSMEHEVEELRVAANKSMSEALAAKMEMVHKVTILEGEKRELEKQLLDISRHQNSDISVLKSQYDEEVRKREEQCQSIQAEMLGAKKSLRETKQKLNKTSEELLSVSSAKAGIESEKAQLENRLSHLMEEFRQRLERYIHDLTKFVGGLRGHCDTATESSLKHFVEAMFSDIRATHESRVRELEKQNQDIKQSMKDVVQRHEELRTTYQLLQGTLADMGVESLDVEEFKLPSQPVLEPAEAADVRQLRAALQKADLDLSAAKEQSLAAAEHHRSVVNQLQLEMVKILEQARGELDRKLSMTSSSKDRQIVEQQKTVNELRAALASKEAHHQIEASLSNLPGPGSSFGGVVTVDRKLSDLRRQLRQFTSTTQHDLEMERARLKTQLAVAEEELARYKEFVNDRLIRLYGEGGSLAMRSTDGRHLAATGSRQSTN